MTPVDSLKQQDGSVMAANKLISYLRKQQTRNSYIFVKDKGNCSKSFQLCTTITKINHFHS
jgi:hypothetical protein